MKKLIIALTMTVLLALPACALAEKLVFVTTEWPPYVFAEKGQVGGIDTDIVRELCKRNGIEADIQILPWKRALKNVKEGKAIAIFTPKKTEERAKFLYYPDEPMNSEKTVIAALKGSGIKVARVQDLKGKSVGLVRGYTYGSEFDSFRKMEKIVCNDDNQVAKLLNYKRVDTAVGEEGVLKYTASKQFGAQLETLLVLNEEPSYVAFSKASGEKGRILAEKFSQTLRQLKEEGVIEKIRNKYF